MQRERCKWLEICDASDLNNAAYEHLLRSTRARLMVKHTFEAPAQKAKLDMRLVAMGGALVKGPEDRYVKESLDPGRRIIEATPLEFVEMAQEYRLPPDVTEAVKVKLLEGAALPKRREDCIIKLRDIVTSPARRNIHRQLKQRAASLPHAKQLNENINFVFMSLLWHAMNGVDQALSYNFRHGFQIIHDVPASAIYRATDHDLSLKEFCEV